jgi:hypothetical protein
MRFLPVLACVVCGLGAAGQVYVIQLARPSSPRAESVYGPLRASVRAHKHAVVNVRFVENNPAPSTARLWIGSCRMRSIPGVDPQLRSSSTSDGPAASAASIPQARRAQGAAMLAKIGELVRDHFFKTANRGFPKRSL